MSEALKLGISAALVVLLAVVLGIRSLYRIKVGKRPSKYDKYFAHEDGIIAGD